MLVPVPVHHPSFTCLFYSFEKLVVLAKNHDTQTPQLLKMSSNSVTALPPSLNISF